MPCRADSGAGEILGRTTWQPVLGAVLWRFRRIRGIDPCRYRSSHHPTEWAIMDGTRAERCQLGHSGGAADHGRASRAGRQPEPAHESGTRPIRGSPALVRAYSALFPSPGVGLALFHAAAFRAVAGVDGRWSPLASPNCRWSSGTAESPAGLSSGGASVRRPASDGAGMAAMGHQPTSRPPARWPRRRAYPACSSFGHSGERDDTRHRQTWHRHPDPRCASRAAVCRASCPGERAGRHEGSLHGGQRADRQMRLHPHGPGRL